jgi:HEAT repeat protein
MALIKASHSADAANPAREQERDCASLEKNLSNPSAVTRRWAARDLAECPDSSAALVACLRVEAEPSVREVILTTLTRLGDSTAVAGLVECMRSEDAALRNEAIEAMKLLPDAVAPIMRDLLNDANSDMRIFAVNILESLKHPDVELWLREVIERDPHVNVCATAVDLLGEVGSEGALESLRQLKTRFAGQTYIQFAADLAIKRILED